MNIIKNKITLAAAVAAVGMGLNSCSLDMLPLNDVVLENYWTDKSDVESVMASCYSGMQEGGYISSTIVWGEDRSDNIVAGQNVPGPLRDLMKGSIRTTNTYCNWAPIYNVINRCNTMLHYAPEVAKKDPNYTPSDLNVNIAECKAIRAISYLTLIKTFRDVPFTMEPSIDDNVDYRLPQTKFEVILDTLIKDIEGCKDFAPRKYSTKIDNTAKITRAAMYSILAELYLWRASDYNLTPSEQNDYYRKCIEACDWVIDFKIQQYKNNDIEDEDLSKLIDTKVWSEFGYPLLSETGGSMYKCSSAFNSIFGTGNSFESIFELCYNSPSNTKINEDVGFMYGGYDDKNKSVTYVTANDQLMTSAPVGETFDNSKLFSTATDLRSILSFRYSEGGAYEISKYSCRSVDVDYSGTEPFTKYTTLSARANRSHSQMYPNWIFYRLTEIMLFRAEAEIEIAANLDKAAAAEEEEQQPAEGDNENEGEQNDQEDDVPANMRKAQKGADLQTAEELYDDAFNLISAVYLRSNPAARTKSTARPVRTNFKSYSDFSTLLMNERRRELLFEGKRYFDLVRQARREGNTGKFVLALNTKFTEGGGAAIAIKMKQMDFMYMPVLKTQMQVNLNLVQNSAYLDEEQIIKN